MKTVFPESIKAVMFDKDGTLLDFEKTWRPLVDKVMSELPSLAGVSSEELQAGLAVLGINSDGFEPDSIFVKGNFAEMIEALGPVDSDPMSSSAIKDYFLKLIGEADRLIVPHMFDAVPGVLNGLKSKGFRLALATSDRLEIAEMHIRACGIGSCFDSVFADDGRTRPKPDRQMLDAFCTEHDLRAEQVAVVGDSMNDVLFGKNNGMGYTVYVRSGFPDKAAESLADIVLTGVGDIIC